MSRHLSLHQRQAIETLTSEGLSMAAIARETGVHRSTIKREIDRNSDRGQYRASVAQVLSKNRKIMAVYYKQAENRYTIPTMKLTYRRFRKPEKYRKRYYRKDNRPYNLHPNRVRDEDYHILKREHEKIYRWRNYKKIERKRGYRSMQKFNSYVHFPVCEMLRQHFREERQHNRLMRDFYFERRNRRELAAIHERLDYIETLILKSQRKEEEPPPTEEKQLPIPPVCIFLYIHYAIPYPERLFIQTRAGPVPYAPARLLPSIF